MKQVLPMLIVASLVLLGGCATGPATRGDSANTAEWQQVVPPSEAPLRSDPQEDMSTAPAQDGLELRHPAGEIIWP